MKILTETIELSIAALGGYGIVLVALFTFFGTIQLKKFAIKLKDDLDKSREIDLHFVKAKFDNEFAVYQNLWLKMCSVEESTYSMIDHLLKNEANNKEQFVNYVIELKMAIKFIRENRPFYAYQIEQDAYKIIYRLSDWASSTAQKDGGEHTDIKVLRNQINTMFDDLSVQIRNRLNTGDK
ncbi:hypothetical protein [Aliivibrio salmonicida]|uniref:hypothetical protein n=1 Tax=Aliivibrio salmonicida TaxID=40269 RepID=UPI003D122ECC